MLAILPLICFALLTLVCWRLGLGLRRSILLASMAWSLFIVYVTETLSAFHALSRMAIASSWTAFALLSAFLVYAATPRRLKAPITVLHGDESAPGLLEWSLLLAAGLATVIVALTALISAPNTWDAMEYHLPRVVQWIGNHGVQFYPTIDRQQLSMPPLAEYTMMHLDLLFGSDRLVNLVQWFAYVGSIVGVSLIAEELGGDRRAQLMAAIFAATLQTAVLAGSGAKNDNVLTYWIVLTVYWLLVWKREQTWCTALAIGISGSLAAFSKGTAYVFMPGLLLACWMIWEWPARRRLLLWLPAFAVIIASVCGPLWARNYVMTGSPLGLRYYDGAGPDADRSFSNASFSPALAVAGVVRNLAINLSVPNNQEKAIVMRASTALIRMLGEDPNDQGQIYRRQSGLTLPFSLDMIYWKNEILSANQLALALFVLASCLYLWHSKNRNRELTWYALGVVAAFVMFSAILRWAPWNGRYQIPVFTLSAAFSAVVLARYLPRGVALLLELFLVMFALALSVSNSTRPLISGGRFPGSSSILVIPREKTYFLDQHMDMADELTSLARTAAATKCNHLGLDARLLHFEYPVMALVDPSSSNRRFSYINVDNPTVSYGDDSVHGVCSVICLGCSTSSDKMSRYGAQYSTVQTFGRSVLFSNPKEEESTLP